MALLLLPLNMPQRRLLEWGVLESASVVLYIHVLILPPKRGLIFLSVHSAQPRGVVLRVIFSL